MPKRLPVKAFTPPFQAARYGKEDRANLAPFFTNLTKSVYVPLIFSPEVIGALCSRTSRAAGDLRTIFLNEYITPFLVEKGEYGRELKQFIRFLQQHPIETIFSNPRARSFYAKWLAQYGDDSIAQMAGMHLVFGSISQLAIKHYEDQRIALAPIEKSTRYVDYSAKINGQYMYYTDPTLRALKLEKEYRQAMDGLFMAYTSLMSKLSAWLTQRYPKEKLGVIEKKAFDTLRGLLPMATLSQVAFFGNGQSFEYAVSRSLQHPLGEIRWAGQRIYEELYKITPSFLRRIKDPEKKDRVENYQQYLSGKADRVAPLADRLLKKKSGPQESTVRLLEYDKDGETKIITSMLYSGATTHQAWPDILARVRKLSGKEKRAIIDAYFAGRTERWQKVGRALENAYVRFEITMNIGAWRDLQRHRMLTQQRQFFSTQHGYDVPPEIIEAGFAKEFQKAIKGAESVYKKIAKHDKHLAQYAVTLAHRVRFMQWENLRECFWELELRTIPEGHPDYRHIEQAKFRLLEKVYPLLCERMRVNLAEYDFARRGQEEKIQAKLRELTTLKS
jgi:thymidylate synthase ThyX